MRDAHPALIGRSEDGTCGVRSTTSWRCSVNHEFVGGACGSAQVDLFVSEDRAHRGGVVLRVRVHDDGCAMLPLAKNIPGGVELHLAGDDEADVVCTALIQVLAQRGLVARTCHSRLHALPTADGVDS